METARRYYNEEFCTQANISNAIKNLSEELYVTGLPTLPEYNVQNPVANQHNMICSLANVLWALIQLNRQTLELKREAENKLITLNSDNNSLKVKVKHMTEELTSVKGKVRLERVKNKQMELDRDASKEEVKTLQRVVDILKKDQHSKTQIYCREIKKSCDESVKLRRILNNTFAKSTLKKTVTRSSDNKNKNYEENAIPSGLEHVKTEGESYQTVNVNALCKKCVAENLTLSKEELYKRSICRLQNTITALVQEANMARQRYLDLSCDMITVINEHTKVCDTDDDHIQITKSMHVMPSDYDLIDLYTKRVLEQLKTNDCKC